MYNKWTAYRLTNEEDVWWKGEDKLISQLNWIELFEGSEGEQEAATAIQVLESGDGLGNNAAVCCGAVPLVQRNPSRQQHSRNFPRHETISNFLVVINSCFNFAIYY